MTKRDKVGLGILVVLFAFFALVLIWTLRETYQPSRDMSQGFFVQQRIRILDRNR